METNAQTVVKKSFSKEERHQIIQNWEKSGQSKPVFAKENGINYHTLVSWMSPKKKIIKVISNEKPFEIRNSEIYLITSH
ncbi:MAG: hypothetical protein IPN13_03550 [Bacteroidetes bacterium]|nr:hypothetical protein [Bacteroidota bacterium]